MKTFFTDPQLMALIDQALSKNQELHIAELEVAISQFEVLAKEGEYLPKVAIGAGAGIEKVGEDTSQGRADEATRVHQHLPDYVAGLGLSWEIDIWRKLRNAKDAAAKRYLSGIEGRRFLVTSVVAEVATSYYELMALDNLLEVLKLNIQVQKDALEVVRIQRKVGRVTELAVKRFEAEVLKNQSRLYVIQQQINETENRLNTLVGKFREPITRYSRDFVARTANPIREGVPAQLLANRPDVKQAELQLEAAKLDVEVARARFYPSLGIEGAIGYHSFKAASFVDTPASLAYLLAARLVAPVWNRNELTATYYSANSKQMQAVWNYERTIVRAYNEVSNQLTAIQNLESSYGLQSQQVTRLDESVNISTDLFKSARADYMEVLLTRRDALEAQMELIEIKRQQMCAVVKLYRALGGGWN
jgi:NodT family efflux transporter outer membrane factor (OMF) lipoprotein